MKQYLYILTIAGCFLAVNTSAQRARGPVVTLLTAPDDPARVQYGAEKLERALTNAGYRVHKPLDGQPIGKGRLIVIRKLEDTFVARATPGGRSLDTMTIGKEGFNINADSRSVIITGRDNSGLLYGCLELAERVKAAGKLPDTLSISDTPEMTLRGTCIGLQKTTYLPGRGVYEYPYTPESFPWFYDKAGWIRYLDMLAENRMNSLYLWNGHPFASLVRLKDYPYAVEVDSATFRKNVEMYRFLTAEADKRGIWVIQMFYNIILSKPFAERNGLKTQDRQRPITPLIADYTRKSIAAFVEQYPNVGLLVTLGEAMEGDDNAVKWFTETIIPGVKDGLRALGDTTQPPIVLRGHDTNPQLVMQAALPLYHNLYTENKYNGEALTTYTPRGPWAAMHREMSRLGSTHIDNVHILANLEPFRYGATWFIQRCVQAMHSIHGANGLHLYPQASYWDWPYTADSAAQRLLQTERDRIWYKAWARYAWNCHRDRQAEITYWTALLDQQYGCGNTAGKQILEAYEQSGEIAPKLLRRFGITNGNRQTLTLGMFMRQLVNPDKWRVWPDLYNSDGPEGETLTVYADREWNGQPHQGETPVQVIREATQHGDAAVAAIEAAAPAIRRGLPEFSRLRNDMYCYRALAHYYAEKATAACWVLRYRHSRQRSDLEKALPPLEKSVAWYRELAALTKGAYRYANSMQTGQRKIPIGGNEGRNKTWTELLPYYEAELQHFRHSLDSLRTTNNKAYTENSALLPAAVTLTAGNGRYNPAPGQRPFADGDNVTIQAALPLLQQLQGIRLSREEQQAKGTTLSFRNAQPVKVVIGFFDTREKGFLRAPDLETNAGADDQGQAAVRYLHAVNIAGLPPVNIHTYYFEAGSHTLQLGKGACLVLGFMDGRQDTGKPPEEQDLDRLF